MITSRSLGDQINHSLYPENAIVENGQSEAIKRNKRGAVRYIRDSTSDRKVYLKKIFPIIRKQFNCKSIRLFH